MKTKLFKKKSKNNKITNKTDNQQAKLRLISFEIVEQYESSRGVFIVKNAYLHEPHPTSYTTQHLRPKRSKESN